MEDEIDIYADLPNFNLEDNENLTEKNKKISEKCTRLEKQVADLTQSLESLKKINNNLEVNLSSLLKTAKAEIARKDRMIADIRQQLDNMKFRRGEYSKSFSQTGHSRSRRKREDSPEERNDIVEVPDVPDTTEFICNPPPSIKHDNNGTKKSYRPNGNVNTVFGERLRIRILEEQEAERKQKEESKDRAAIESKKTTESIKLEQVAESKAKDRSNTDSNLSDPKPNSIVKLQDKGSGLESSSSLNSLEDTDLPKRNNPYRKRQSEDQLEPFSSRKKLKSDNGESRSRHNDEGARGNSKISSKSRIEKESCAEISASGGLSKYQIADEYKTPIENDVRNKSEGINTADVNDESQDRHNRVAIRLMLLAEGIDPDLEAKKPVQNEQKKVIDDKKSSSKKSRETIRSRSKSRNRRYDHKSRSRTPEERWKNRRGSRQREASHRKSRDRFERGRELKNKDGDNLSEFSREICELKERIEHRVDDRSSDRSGKGRSLNRHNRNDERSYRSGRSKTPDSSRSGSKEKTEYKSREDKKYGRSRSRERYKSRNTGKRQSNFDDVTTKSSKTVQLGRKRIEDVEIVPTKVSLQVTENPETKSLLSLEDGEIVDSPSSSPVRAAELVPYLPEVILPSSSKPNSLEPDELACKIANEESPLLLREIGNAQDNEKSVFIEESAKSIPESNDSKGVNDSLNTSKDERIENIAEFIANFTSDVLESKKDEKPNDEIMPNDVGDALQSMAVSLEEKPHHEKIRFIINTVFQESSDDPLMSPLMETTEEVCTKKVNDKNGNDDWCLIAIDSPIKNFDENRKNRMMAQSLQVLEELEQSEIVLTGDQPIKQSNDSSETTCIGDSHKKIDLVVEKVVPDETTKPLSQPIKKTSKTKPVVLTSLRSTYHKGRKEIVLSDTNSEQCTKISMTHPVNSTTNSLVYESETIQQSKDDVNKPIESTSVRSFESKSPVPKDVDRNCENSQNVDNKQSIDDVFRDQNDSGNISDHKESTTANPSDVVCTKHVDTATVDRCVDEVAEKNRKRKVNNSKMEKEITTEIGTSVKDLEDKPTVICKADLSNNCKTDVTKAIGSKNKTGGKAEKTGENVESSVRKSLENGIKPAKSVSKVKVEGSNSKQKKEPQKMVVIARRRKPVHLEDSSTSPDVFAKPSSFDDNVDNSSKNIKDGTKLSSSLDTNTEVSTEHGENEVQKTIANDSANVDTSKFPNVEEERTI